MKRVAIILIAVSACAWTASAQGFGLPIADDAVPAQQGQQRVTVGWNAGEFRDLDMLYLGARFGYGLSGGLEIFGDFGIVDLDHPYGTEPTVQVGALCELPLELPFYAALRGAVQKPFIGDVRETIDGITVSTETEVWGARIDALAGAAVVSVPGLSLYGGLGLTYAKAEFDAHIRARGLGVPGTFTDPPSLSESDSDTHVSVSLGVIYELSDRASLYAELSHVDELFIGFGARMAL